MPAVLIEAMPHGPRRGNLEPTSPWDQCSLPGEHPGCIQEGSKEGFGWVYLPAWAGEGKQEPLWQRVLCRNWKGGRGESCCCSPPLHDAAFHPYVFLAGTLKTQDAASSYASSWPPVPPLCQDSSPWDSSRWLPGELSVLGGHLVTEAVTSTIHRARQTNPPARALGREGLC